MNPHAMVITSSRNKTLNRPPVFKVNDLTNMIYLIVAPVVTIF
jgi:hypothetical protein